MSIARIAEVCPSAYGTFKKIITKRHDIASDLLVMVITRAAAKRKPIFFFFLRNLPQFGSAQVGTTSSMTAPAISAQVYEQNPGTQHFSFAYELHARFPHRGPKDG